MKKKVNEFVEENKWYCSGRQKGSEIMKHGLHLVLKTSWTSKTVIQSVGSTPAPYLKCVTWCLGIVRSTREVLLVY